MGGRRGSAEATAWYVAGKHAAPQALVVVQGHDHPLLASQGRGNGCRCTGLSHAARAPFRLRSQGALPTGRPTALISPPKRWHAFCIDFDEPQRAP